MNATEWADAVLADLGEQPPQYVLDLLAAPHKLIVAPRQNGRRHWLGQLLDGDTILDTLKQATPHPDRAVADHPSTGDPVTSRSTAATPPVDIVGSEGPGSET